MVRASARGEGSSLALNGVCMRRGKGGGSSLALNGTCTRMEGMHLLALNGACTRMGGMQLAGSQWCVHTHGGDALAGPQWCVHAHGGNVACWPSIVCACWVVLEWEGREIHLLWGRLRDFPAYGWLQTKANGARTGQQCSAQGMSESVPLLGAIERVCCDPKAAHMKAVLLFYFFGEAAQQRA